MVLLIPQPEQQQQPPQRRRRRLVLVLVEEKKRIYVCVCVLDRVSVFFSQAKLATSNFAANSHLLQKDESRNT